MTTILHEVLAAPAIARWNYNLTRDNIAGLVAVSKGFDAENGLSVMEIVEDADLLEEWLADNQLRPQDVLRESADRGSREHEVFAGLSEGDGIAQAERLLANKSSTGHTRAIARWWLDTNPEVIASESVVYALEPYGGFAGTLDLVRAESGGPVLSDLKTRKPGAGSYASDDIQTGAYQLAWEAMGNPRISRRTTLVARADGTYEEFANTIPPSAFLHLLAVYSMLKGR